MNYTPCKDGQCSKDCEQYKGGKYDDHVCAISGKFVDIPYEYWVGICPIAYDALVEVARAGLVVNYHLTNSTDPDEYIRVLTAWRKSYDTLPPRLLEE